MKQFCENMIYTKENLCGTDCVAHIIDGRIFKCPYKNLTDMINANYKCEDYISKK